MRDIESVDRSGTFFDEAPRPHHADGRVCRFGLMWTPWTDDPPLQTGRTRSTSPSPFIRASIDDTQFVAP